jgi:hypothetical protein
MHLKYFIVNSVVRRAPVANGAVVALMVES